MACPFFEPDQPVEMQHPFRLPLIDEYTGYCHLRGSAVTREANPRLRLLGCNHGNLQRVCAFLNQQDGSGARGRPARFSVRRRGADRLWVLFVEEENGRPYAWQEFEYHPQDGSVLPDLVDACRRAQLLAFCRSYLTRYPLSA
jgi:hypothetical protein